MSFHPLCAFLLKNYSIQIIRDILSCEIHEWEKWVWRAVVYCLARTRSDRMHDHRGVGGGGDRKTENIEIDRKKKVRERTRQRSLYNGVVGRMPGRGRGSGPGFEERRRNEESTTQSEEPRRVGNDRISEHQLFSQHRYVHLTSVKRQIRYETDNFQNKNNWI